MRNMSQADYANAHRKYLEEFHPDLYAELKARGDLQSRLSLTGEMALQAFLDRMSSLNNSPQFQSLPHQERVRQLEEAQLEANQGVMNEFVYDPPPLSSAA